MPKLDHHRRETRSALPLSGRGLGSGPDPAVLSKMAELFQVLGSASGDPPQTAVSADELVQALLDRLVRRMPKSGTKDQPGEVCLYTGLNRGALYELMRKRENGRPVIRTVTLRGENEAHGARFYYVGSVLRYLDRLAEEQAGEGLAGDPETP